MFTDKFPSMRFCVATMLILNLVLFYFAYPEWRVFVCDLIVASRRWFNL
jgi:hypothetical protein